MARPQTITNESILEAAREVFLDQGYKAPTSEIARLAGISEGTIFRRFGNKERLFLSCMGVEGKLGWFQTIEDLQGTGDLEENLIALSHEILDFFEEMLPRIHTLNHSGLKLDDIFKHFKEMPPPVRGIKALTTFFDCEQQLGRVRHGDTEIMARLFLGGLNHYAWAQVTGFNAWLPMPRGTYIRGLVHTLLTGVEKK